MDGNPTFLSCPDHSPGRALAPPRVTPSSSPALVASVKDLYDFICSGPLVDRIGYTKEKVAESIDRWLRCGSQIARLFRLNELQLSEAEKVRIYHFYIPVFLWCEDQVTEHRAKYKEGDDIPPLVIGVSAPQGSGKTTLVFTLDYLFRVAGRNSTTLSIDDFYLTAKEQNELRDRNPGNALLELRGNAGSHDLQFSVETLESLTKLTKEGMKMKVPRYDKSAFGGRGDRADPSVWPDVEGPLEVILFEGWMLGFKPLPNEVVKAVDPQLEVVNKNLEAYYNAWDRFIESWIVIKIREPNCVFQWRLQVITRLSKQVRCRIHDNYGLQFLKFLLVFLQAEIAMRADGKPGMSDEEVMDFVSRYLPAYHAYLPTLYKEGPNGSKPEQLLVIDIDEGRNPLWGS
ncbi:D-glycerate 3-kinase, chloroplastic-like isoform X3 [Panicum virgatum]|uniref:D-glycerate 3-kinase, chloroplastic-like isoform X3 n=1 Tax=Panicum virgatum TaxID=38727 RepID=UPI0019D6A614|nr:D-glycerate 3-kinase, chloroplastic-like isoform X3 [Panicum virgatum]